MKKKVFLSLVIGLGLVANVSAQQKENKVNVKSLGATVEVVSRGEQEFAENGGAIRDVTVKITPSEETQTTAALCFQKGEMEYVYNAGGYSALEMFNLYEQAYSVQKGGSMFKEGTYDTTFHALWDTVENTIWVCCAGNGDTLVISQDIPAYSESSLDVIDVNLDIYPNPTAERISVSSSVNIQEAELINASGQSVLKKQINGNNFAINVTEYTKGVYFLRLKTDKNTLLKKIIIK